jgi:hypothetical protein
MNFAIIEPFSLTCGDQAPSGELQLSLLGLFLFAHQVETHLMTGLAVFAGDPLGLEAVFAIKCCDAAVLAFSSAFDDTATAVRAATKTKETVRNFIGALRLQKGYRGLSTQAARCPDEDLVWKSTRF